MKIMVIDDVSMNILRLKQATAPFCEADGFLEARTGLDQLQRAYASGEPYDLLFLDIVMPEINGFDVLEAVTRLGTGLAPESRTKVVMLTARSQEESVRQAIRGGAAAYVIKPFQDARVHAIIQKLTGVAPATARDAPVEPAPEAPAAAPAEPEEPAA